MRGLDKPWVVVDGVVPDPDKVIEAYGDALRDLSDDGASDGETRVVHGRLLDDAAVAAQVGAALEQASDRTGIVYDAVEPFRLLRYRAGGHYSWHADNELLEEPHRKLSVVLALNEGFGGGHTEFMWPRPGASEVVRLAPGSAVVFPSFLYHRALQVTSGERWVLTTWTNGPSFR